MTRALRPVAFVLNGRRVSLRVHPLKRLLDVLREDCGLTGTKEGCGEGECGACTVLLDGRAVNSCLVPVAQAAGSTVLTIEGLRGRHPLQRAFAERGGTQCGICTPGMILAAVALGPRPTREEVRRGLAGNICRCTGYEGIYRAIGSQKPEARSRKPEVGSQKPEARGRKPEAGSQKPEDGRGEPGDASRLEPGVFRPRVAEGAEEAPVRTALSPLVLLRPRTLREALRMLRDEGPLTPLAGCTDVYVGFNAGTNHDARFVDLWGLDALRGIAIDGGSLRLGALTTYADLMRSPLVRRRLPMLAAAAGEVGAVQIQNRGTIGGNIANGSPAGDTLPVLAAAEALVELRAADWTRKVPFVDYYTGYRASVRRPDEIVAAVEIPPVAGAQWFRKVGTRAAQSISKVVMAGVRAEQPRVALGSVAPTVVRARCTEAALAAGAPIREAQRILQEEISPIDDIRSTAAYRREVAARLLAQFWSATSP